MSVRVYMFRRKECSTSAAVERKKKEAAMAVTCGQRGQTGPCWAQSSGVEVSVGPPAQRDFMVVIKVKHSEAHFTE